MNKKRFNKKITIDNLLATNDLKTEKKDVKNYDKIKTTMRLSKDLHKKLKFISLSTEKTLEEIVENCLFNFVKDFESSQSSSKIFP